MFRKRLPRTFPPGTFIPAPARVMAIAQLCVAFVVICWQLGTPFLTDLYHYKRQALVYQFVLGGGEQIERAHQTDPDFLLTLERHRQYFTLLPLEQQQAIIKGYESLKKRQDRSFSGQLSESIEALAGGLHPYALLWLILAVAISIMILRKREGAAPASWLLPAISAAFAIDLYLFALPAQQTPEQRLFPQDSYLVDHYLEGRLTGSISEQQERLREAWHAYLVKEWSANGSLEQGIYAFQAARAAVLEDPVPPTASCCWPILLAYFVWNCAFALTVNRYRLPMSQEIKANSGDQCWNGCAAK